MMKYAVVVAGVPGRIVLRVQEKLRARFSDNHVVRVPGAILHDDDYARYDNTAVSQIIQQVEDAVFGKTKRPHGFCRRSERPCARMKPENRRHCGKLDDTTCLLEKPDALIVIYQEGHQEDKLLKSLHYSAITAKLSKETYNREERTYNSIINHLSRLKENIGKIKRAVETSKSPLRLPPLNCENEEVIALLDKMNASGDTEYMTSFKRKWFQKKTKAYACRKSILMKPAELSDYHGVPTLDGLPSLAISANYRLGVCYPSDFQFDVYREDEKHFDGNTQFYCRKTGSVFPKADHVNVSVDDRVI